MQFVSSACGELFCPSAFLASCYHIVVFDIQRLLVKRQTIDPRDIKKITFVLEGKVEVVTVCGSGTNVNECKPERIMFIADAHHKLCTYREKRLDL